jgi:hypothetical protein
METKPGVLLKLTSHTSTELFEEALTMKNARNVCGQLMSLIVANKGLTNSPVALLANQMRSHLFTIHASDPSNSLPGWILILCDDIIIYEYSQTCFM